MSNPFFDQPILNSPYERPTRHWELDEDGQPTQRIIEKKTAGRIHFGIPKIKEAEGIIEVTNHYRVR